MQYLLWNTLPTYLVLVMPVQVVVEELVNKLKNKINYCYLKVFYILSKENGDEFDSPLFFKLKNKSNEFYQVCGVREFSAPPGVIHAPYYVMNTLGIRGRRYYKY